MYALRELLLIESVERIIRTEVFLNDVLKDASDEDTNIVKLYQSSIESIKDQIVHPLEIMKLYHRKDIPKEILKGCINECLNVFIRIRKLHSLLAYVPNLQTKTETYTLVQSVFKEISSIKDKKLELSIVLFDIYNYEMLNISQTLKDGGLIEKDVQCNRLIIELPKIERNNPLMWTILIHEIGHTLDNNYLKVTERVFSNIQLPSNQLRILKNWTKECVSDLISLKIMGPSYMLSFMFFNLLIGDLERFSETHPSAKWRLSFMESKLCEFNSDIRSILELLDERKDFDLDVDENLCQECWQRMPKQELNQENLEVLKNELNKIVIEILKAIETENINQFTFDQYCRTVLLSESLKAGIPISSSRILNDSEITKLCKSFNKNKENIYELLKKFEEKPNSISEIINAGWNHKIKNVLPEAISLFFENNDNFKIKYRKYHKILDKNDNVLSKSIEIADIHSLFEMGRNLS